MATKRKPTKDFMQYSKRLATFVAVCWSAGRLLAMGLIAWRPEAASAIVNYIRGLDDVMMVNLGFYAGNSVAEKGIIGYFGRKDSSEKESEEKEEEENG